MPGLRTSAALLLLCAAVAPAAPAAAIDWSHAQLLAVDAVEYRFEPNRLELHRGTAYRLHLVNRGKEMHEFTAAAFFGTAVLGNPQVMNSDHTELVVQPGEQRDLLFVPRKAGRFPLSCADHDWAGMTGEIVVK
jgi:uncharacterized cupredoxin-like copper-binding protein